MIDRFKGRYAFLSNFTPSPIEFEGLIYPSVEHAYQAAKTVDLAARERIRRLAFAREAKAAGRRVTLRSDWERVKIEIMRGLVRKKFDGSQSVGRYLAEQLLATGEEQLVEGNDWGDRFWGVCDGVGENYLGKILMEVRADLRRGVSP